MVFSSMNVVLVYLGATVPRYVFLNLLLIQKRFPHCQVVFLTDFTKNVEAANRLGVCSILVPSPEDNWKITPESFHLDADFRSGFWYKTFARFHSLSYFAATKPLESFLHVESDVLLLHGFPFDKFKMISEPLAFPLSNAESAAASTLYVKNYSGFAEFLDFAEIEVHKNPLTTDMSVLAKYANHFPERVLILPSTLDSNLSFTEITPQKEYSRFHSNINLFEGIFDANTWGQFLTGQDERNFYGIRKLYHTILDHAVEPQKFEFFFDKNLCVSIDSRQACLYSLHIHSKNKRFFKKETTEAAVQSAVNKSSGGPKYKFNLFCFILLLPNTLNKLSRRVYSRF
jgi:hypothetical protein